MTLIELLQTYNIPYRESREHHHVTEGWVGIDCPWCSPGSGRFRLGYNQSSHAVSCWTCGRHSLTDLIHVLTGKSLTESKKLRDSIPRRARNWDLSLSEGILRLPRGVGPMTECHWNYLRKRGFGPPEIERLWSVQGIGLEIDLAWRLFIPIKEKSGRVISWTTRSIGDASRRYVTAKSDQGILPAKSVLYGEEHTWHTAVIVEGPLDCWAIGPGAVATLGISYTKEQLDRMASYPTRVVCFDNEPEAQKRAKDLAQTLSGFPGRTHLVTLDAKDPASATKEEISQLRSIYLP